jgi:hypothetical protein
MHIKLYFTLFILIFTAHVNAQTKRQLSLDIKRSFNGSGDMHGLGFSVEVGKYIRKKLELTGAVSSDIYHDEYKILITDGVLVNGGRTIDASYRMVTAGAQLSGGINYAPVRTKTNEVKIGAGPLLRYQSSGDGGYEIFSPARTGLPEPVFAFRQNEPQNIITVGYLVSVAYAYTFSSKLFVGAKASFQNDSNADVITQYGVRIGKRF